MTITVGTISFCGEWVEPCPICSEPVSLLEGRLDPESDVLRPKVIAVARCVTCEHEWKVPVR